MSTVIPVPDPSLAEDEAPAVGLATTRQLPPSNASNDCGFIQTAVSCTATQNAERVYQRGSRWDGDGRWSDLAKRHLSNSGFLPWAVPLNGMLLLLGLYMVFHDVFKPMPSLPVFTVIMLSSWLGGRASGIFATALGALLIAYAYLPPDDSLEVAWPDGVLLLGGFIGLGILMSILIASVDSSRLKRELKRSVPAPLKDFYRAGARVFSTSAQPLRARDIDLERTLIGGYNAFTAGEWADLVGEPRCASMLLRDSPHVRFLEDYRGLGEAVFEPAHFEQTAYFKHALEAIRVAGDYFGYVTRDGVLAQARAFATLYDRIRIGDRTEVSFGKPKEHSPGGSLPVVHRTLTPGTMQIVHGHHRLAIAWVLGQRQTRAVVTAAKPTELQRLAFGVKQTKELRELYQPIDSPEFDSSWRLTRRCDDRLRMMEQFLAAREQLRVNRHQEPPSMVDLACSYGWFVAQFARQGWHAQGVEADPSAIRIGRIAYGLGADQTTHSTIQAFLHESDRKFDVVLCLSILHHFVMNPRPCSAEDLLRQVDAITGSVLFFDIGQHHEEWFKERLPEWDDAHIVQWIKQNTSFTQVIKLGVDSDDVGPYRTNYRRSLFACIRD